MRNPPCGSLDQNIEYKAGKEENMEQKEKMFDYEEAKWAVLMLELEGYNTLLKSRQNTRFVGKEWFNYIGKYCDIYDTNLQIINESELYIEISFILEDEYYTVAYMARCTESGLRGYMEDGEPIYGFVEGEEIYNIKRD